MDPKVILETALHREELSAIEALLLMQEGKSLRPAILDAADRLNRRINGTDVTYVRARQVSFTNICRAECSFCPFWRKKGQRGAFVLSPGEVLRQIRDAGPLRQIDLQGSLNADLQLPYYIELLRAIKDEHPNLHVHGLSPAEVHFLSRRSRITPADILRRLRDAGLDSLSGDSADILNDKIRKKVSHDKLRTADWVEIIRTAHRLGLPTTATMLFGHVEDEIQISEHLDIIKHVQRETGGIAAFEPIPFLPAGSELSRDRRPVPGPDPDFIVQVVAIARIFFARSIPTIQVDWTKMGWETAARALQAGANEIGPLGIDAPEIRSPEIGRTSSMPVTSLRAGIKRAGRNPVEREGWPRRVAPIRTRQEEPVLV